MHLNSGLFAVALFCVSLVLRHRLKKNARPAPLPPGPKGLPILGNLLDIPQKKPWETFTKWKNMFGEIVYINALGNNLVILNDPKYVTDLLEKRGALYSDRPHLMMASELVGWGEGPALIRFGETWSEYRRLIASFLGTRSKVELQADILQQEASEFLHRLRETPLLFSDHCRTYAVAIVLTLTYGYKVESDNDNMVMLGSEAMRQFSETTVNGAFLVDTFPFLRFVPEWFPGAGWKRKARHYRQTLQNMIHVPYNWTKTQMSEGAARPCFLTQQLEDKTVTALEEQRIRWAAAGIYSGGADTVVATIRAFFLAAVRHTPEVQKAQAELDKIIGPHRLVTLADRSDLPYCEALYLETLRKYTIGPVGLPHVVREDDIYNGYFIPKGSLMFPNNWCFFHDENTYTNPYTFDPERFLKSDKSVKAKDPRDYIYGYGRRVCPGIYLADTSTWLACITMIDAFDISPPIKDGKPATPPPAFEDGMISHPAEFEISLAPRPKFGMK